MAYLHLRRSLGSAHAALELGGLALYGFAIEYLCMLIFGSHTYGSAWGIVLLGVPVAVALAWAAVIVASMALAKCLRTSPLGIGALAALIAITLDLLIEPVAVRAGLWHWTPPGPWLGIPIGNFVGWAVIVGAWVFGAERWGREDLLTSHALQRLALALSSAAALVVVGVLWRRFGIEGLFRSGSGWIVWGSLLAATSILTLRRRPTVSSGSRALPSGALILVAATFAFDQTFFPGRELSVVLLGSGLVLSLVLCRVHARPWMDRARRGIHTRLAAARGLVFVLMKPRNGLVLTAQDKAFLLEEAKTLARRVPLFFVLLLPGGILLLPALAWFLDRRRSARRIRRERASKVS